ncbi:hypothetical protein B0H13DRAFT_1896132 [Mycena leptocephala]|nr:hypothetical protein B0H13DRAFT_1896132 [Mycena leptocephala]
MATEHHWNDETADPTFTSYGSGMFAGSQDFTIGGGTFNNFVTHYHMAPVVPAGRLCSEFLPLSEKLNMDRFSDDPTAFQQFLLQHDCFSRIPGVPDGPLPLPVVSPLQFIHMVIPTLTFHLQYFSTSFFLPVDPSTTGGRRTPIRLTLSFTTHPFPSNPLLRWKLYRPSPPSSGSFRPVAGAFPAANADSVPSGSSFPAFNGNGSGSRPSTGTRGSRRSQRSSARQPFDAEVDAELDVNAAHLGRSRRGGWS